MRTACYLVALVVWPALAGGCSRSSPTTVADTPSAGPAVAVADTNQPQFESELNFPRSMARMWGVSIVVVCGSRWNRGSSLFRRNHGIDGYFRPE